MCTGPPDGRKGPRGIRENNSVMLMGDPKWSGLQDGGYGVARRVRMKKNLKTMKKNNFACNKQGKQG